MEWLTLEVVEKVAKYLMPRELAACCSVNVEWRDIFNQDSLWRTRCNRETAKYLETAECRVQPTFVSPESEGSTLSPVCRWRMNYMREIHLHNNWRQGRAITEVVKVMSKTALSKFLFISNDYMLIFDDGRRVMLWDVRRSPIYLREPFRLMYSSVVWRCEMIKDNMLLIGQGPSLQVYHFVSILDETWHLKHLINLEGSGTQPPSADLMAQNKYFFLSDPLTAIGHIYVVRDQEEVNILHIWDVLEGKKLKIVECNITPDSRNTIHEIIKFEKPCQDFVIISKSKIMKGFRYFLNIYRLNILDFLPFTVSYDVPNKPTHLTYRIKCVLQDRFVAISVNNSLYIYSYLMSELVVNVPTTTDCNILGIGNRILFSKNEKFCLLFNTSSAKIESLTVTNTRRVPPVPEFKEILMSNLFLTLRDGKNRLSKCDLWELGRSSKSESVAWLGLLVFNNTYNANKSYTKIMFESYSESSLNLVCYW